MRFEKISDNKLKIELTLEDLTNRGIEITEIAYGNNKARELLHDLIEKAMKEVKFFVDERPLLIEAVPKSQKLIEIFITKLVDEEKSLLDLGLDFEKLKGDTLTRAKSLASSFDAGETMDLLKRPSNVLIYKFEKLDDVIYASKILYDDYDGKSELYKYENKYYLALRTSKIKEKMSYVVGTMLDFADKLSNDEVSLAFLKESGTIVVKSDAIKKLKDV